MSDWKNPLAVGLSLVVPTIVIVALIALFPARMIEICIVSLILIFALLVTAFQSNKRKR